MENIRAQMRKGLLEYLILLMVNQKEVYASDILSTLRDARLIVVEGTIYPLLTRMKNNGWVTYRWEESSSGPPRKYYQITPVGKETLEMLEQSWNDLTEAIQRIKNTEL